MVIGDRAAGYNLNQMEEEFVDEAMDLVLDETLPKTLSHRISEFEDLHLKYSYSGMSNASSSNDFMLTTTKSFNEDYVKLTFVAADSLFDTIVHLASELNKRMLLH